MSNFDASAPRQDFTFTQGDDDTFAITYSDKDGNAEDITGWTFWLTVKESHTDDDNDAVIQKTVTSHHTPLEGQTDIPLTASDTGDLVGNYYYDMQRKDATGDVKTFVHGTMTFIQDITESTT